MRMVVAAVIALCSFLCPQTNIAVAEEAPAWLPGEYVGTVHPPSGALTMFFQIKGGTVEAAGGLAIDIHFHTDRNTPDWTPVRLTEAKLVSPERATIAFTSTNGTKYNLVAKPDGSLSGTAQLVTGQIGNYTFTKRN